MPSGKYQHKKYIRTKDFTNQKFGKLTAIKRLENYEEPSGKERTYWLLICDCGEEVKRRTDALQNNKKLTQSCRTCANKMQSERAKIPRLTEKEQWFNYCYGGYRNGAKKRKIYWDLSKNNFVNLITKNCHYCNNAPLTRKTVRLKIEFEAHGLDRLNSELGYTEQNVVTCCWICNKMKSDMTYDEFISHILAIARNKDN